MNGQPTQTEIANALGLARSRITAMKKMGCPVSSIQAAKAWYSRNIMANQSEGDELSDCNAFVLLVGEILEDGGRIDELVPDVRAMLIAVPAEERGQVDMPIVLWRYLCAYVIALMESDPEHEAGNTAPVDDGYMGEFWYQVACGYWKVNSRPVASLY